MSSADWVSRAEELLADGLPYDLSAPAATAYVDKCREVLEVLGPGDSRLAVQLLTAQAVASAQSPDGHAEDIAEVAAQMATRLGDELAHAYVLVARSMAQPMPEHAGDRLVAARKILDVAERHGDAALIPVGYHILLVALLEKGEIRSLDIELMNRRNTAAGVPRPHHLDVAGWFGCLRSILDGDTALAEKQATELFVAADRPGSNALSLYTTQLGIIGWMQGRIDGAEEGFLAARREHPEQLLWSASLAWLLHTQGRRAAAEELLRSLPSLEDLPRDRYWLCTVTVLAQVAVDHGSRERAEEIRRMLSPFAGQLVPVGNGVAFWGTAARTLGLLEERLGMLTEARAHLEQAIAITSRIEAQAWLAEAQIELAEFALRHDLTDIPAYGLLTEAKLTSEARGFAGLAARAVHPAQIRVFGRFEVTSSEGIVADWTSRKARDLLKMLVAARGIATSREVFMEKLWPGEDPAVLGNRFSVAVNVIRRALDPQKTHSRQHNLVIEGESIRLDLDHVDVDLERFFLLTQQPEEVSLERASDMFTSGAFPDEPYAEWAIAARDEVQHAWISRANFR